MICSYVIHILSICYPLIYIDHSHWASRWIPTGFASHRSPGRFGQWREWRRQVVWDMLRYAEICRILGGFHKWGGSPIAGWFIVENPIKMDGLVIGIIWPMSVCSVDVFVMCVALQAAQVWHLSVWWAIWAFRRLCVMAKFERVDAVWPGKIPGWGGVDLGFRWGGTHTSTAA